MSLRVERSRSVSPWDSVERKRKAQAKSERAACPLETQQSQGFEIATLRYRSARNDK
jgi:hypothetical protein